MASRVWVMDEGGLGIPPRGSIVVLLFTRRRSSRERDCVMELATPRGRLRTRARAAQNPKSFLTCRRRGEKGMFIPPIRTGTVIYDTLIKIQRLLIREHFRIYACANALNSIFTRCEERGFRLVQSSGERCVINDEWRPG